MSYLQTKMEEVDFDYIVSKNTLAYIEKTCLEYKIRILKDLAENIDVPFTTLNEQFLDKPKINTKYHGKPRDQIDQTKCMARIWHTKLGAVQCSRNRLKPCDNKTEDEDNIDLNPMFCKIHQNKLNYGRIDMPFENYDI